jgi:hypothetical protein
MAQQVAYLVNLKISQKAFALDASIFARPSTLHEFGNIHVGISHQAGDRNNFWPLWEYLEGKYKINWATEDPKALEEFLKTQGRFKHLFKPGNEKVIAKMQKEVDEDWKRLVNMTEI